MSTTGTIPSAVVKRSERARKAGWSDSISVRVRDGRTSVLHRIRDREGRRATACHIDGKPAFTYLFDPESGLVRRFTLRELDAAIRADQP